MLYRQSTCRWYTICSIFKYLYSRLFHCAAVFSFLFTSVNLYTSYLAYSCNFVAFVNIWMQTLCAAHRLLFRDLIYMQCSKFACRIPLREKNIISAVKQKTLSLNCCYVRTTTTTTEKKFFLLFFCTIDSRRALRMTAKFVHNSTFHIFLSATVWLWLNKKTWFFFVVYIFFGWRNNIPLSYFSIFTFFSSVHFIVFLFYPNSIKILLKVP